jgi:hypothetical protein
MQHLGGNLLSRWTRFLETDGEKPDRHRDGEFESNRTLTRRDLMELWERGWSRCIESLDSLTPDDLLKTVRIRAAFRSPRRSSGSSSTPPPRADLFLGEAPGLKH